MEYSLFHSKSIVIPIIRTFQAVDAQQYSADYIFWKNLIASINIESGQIERNNSISLFIG